MKIGIKIKGHLCRIVLAWGRIGAAFLSRPSIKGVGKLSLAFLCCFALQVRAQGPREILGLAMDRLGDWSAVTNLRLRMVSMNVDRWQCYDYDQLVFRGGKWELGFDFKSGDFVNHTVDHYPGGYVFDTYRLGLDSTFWVYDGARSRTGDALIELGKELYVIRSKAFQSSFFPYYILKRAYALTELTSDTVNNQIVIRSPGQEFWLDTSSLLLERHVTINNGVASAQAFQDYLVRENLSVPGRTSFSVDGKVYSIDSLSSFKVNLPKDSLGLAFPRGYLQVREYDGPPQVRRLSGNTYLVEKLDSDRNVIFRDMGDYVILTEAPISVGVVKQVINCIAAVLPGKPIRYVHLSHFHQDHIAGIGELVDHGASIICTPETVRPVSELLGQRKVYPDSNQPRFVLIKGELVIGGPGDGISFHAIQNSHARGMSLAWLPREGIIFQGDLLSLPQDGTITPAIEVNREFFDEIRRLRLPYKTIIGHHGLSVMGKDEIAKIDRD